MTFINSKLMLTNPYPFFVGMLRAACSGCFLMIYSWMRHKEVFKTFSLSRQGWNDLIVFGVLVHGFVMCGISYGLQYTDPIKICFMFAMCPFVTMTLEYFSRKDSLTPKKIIGLMIGLFGLIPVLLEANHGEYKNVPAYLEVWGTVVIFVSIVFFSYGWIVIKRFLKTYPDYPIELVNGIAMSVGGLVSFVLFLIFAQGNIFSMHLTQDFSLLATAFIVSSLLTYMIYPYLLKSFTATFIAFAGFLEPAFGLLYGVLFLGNSVTKLSCFSLALLFIGLYIFYKEETKGNGKISSS